MHLNEAQLINSIYTILIITSLFDFQGDLGMDKSSIGTHIEREALCMIELLRKSVGEPVDLNNSLNIAITNIVWAIVAGT